METAFTQNKVLRRLQHSAARTVIIGRQTPTVLQQSL
jgi:hypothetical protein